MSISGADRWVGGWHPAVERPHQRVRPHLQGPPPRRSCGRRKRRAGDAAGGGAQCPGRGGGGLRHGANLPHEHSEGGKGTTGHG